MTCHFKEDISYCVLTPAGRQATQFHDVSNFSHQPAQDVRYSQQPFPGPHIAPWLQQQPSHGLPGEHSVPYKALPVLLMKLQPASASSMCTACWIGCIKHSAGVKTMHVRGTASLRVRATECMCMQCSGPALPQWHGMHDSTACATLRQGPPTCFLLQETTRPGVLEDTCKRRARRRLQLRQAATCSSRQPSCPQTTACSRCVTASV